MYYKIKTYSDFLSEHFNGKVQKIAVNGGFSCPNRDGTLGVRGCAYCDNRSFVPSYCDAADGVGEQLRKGVCFFSRKYPAMRYLAYFQAYSNTYAPLEVLKQRYEEALAVDGVVGIVIATRPDCLPDEVLDYLQELAGKVFVQLEIGVETVHDRTLQLIGRGHDFACAASAIRRVASRGIKVGAHMILGLPGETRSDILQQAVALADLPLDTLKLHQLQVLRGTPMAELYRQSLEMFMQMTPEAYVNLVLDYITLLPQHIAYDRFLNQSPPHMLATKGWGLKNHEFTDLLRLEIDRRNSKIPPET